MDEIFTLFLDLPHQKQLEVIQKLPTLIYRDFITSLPQPIPSLILSFLSFADVVRCLCVCSQWYSVIQSCHTYWQQKCISGGLTKSFIYKNVNKHHSLMHFSITVCCHIHQIENAFTDDTAYLNLKQNGCYFVNNFDEILVYKCNHFDRNVEFSYIPHEKQRLCTFSFNLSCSTTIVWAQLIKNNVILFANDSADWGTVFCNAVDEDVGNVQIWTDCEVVSPSYMKLAACSSCGLVVRVQRHLVAHRLIWEVQFLLLMANETSVIRWNKVINFRELEYDLKETDALFLQGLVVLPFTESETKTESGMGICLSHYLMMQINSAVVVYEYQINNKEMDGSLSFIRALLPDDNRNCFTTIAMSRNNFCISLNRDLVGIIHDLKLHIWDLPTGDVCICISLIPFTNTGNFLCIAIGQLYSLIQENDRLMVLSTLTGDLICNVATGFYNSLCASVTQEWLNDYQTCVLRPPFLLIN